MPTLVTTIQVNELGYASSAQASAAAAAASAIAAADAVPAWRGNWLTATAYALNDLVVQNSIVYICTAAHTSGVFATDLAVPRWAVYTNLTASFRPVLPIDYSGDLNAVPADGLYRITVQAPANKPADATDLRGWTLDHRTSTNALGAAKVQILTDPSMSSTNDGQYVRGFSNGVWGGWRKVIIADSNGRLRNTVIGDRLDVVNTNAPGEALVATLFNGLLILSYAVSGNLAAFSLIAQEGDTTIGMQTAGNDSSSIKLAGNRIGMQFGTLANGSFSVDYYAGAGSPQGVVTAAPGSFYINKNGGAGQTLWVKETGTGNTGWAAK